MTRPADPRWPRASDWLGPPRAPAPGESLGMAVLGVPTWRTSLSPTSAHLTPAAVRAALARFSPYDASTGTDLSRLAVADLGDVADPDGPAGRGRTVAAVAAAAAAADLVVVLGGDNSATVGAALGAWGPGTARAGLVTLDAHHDLRDGTSNGSPVRELVEAGLHGTRVVQVGIADFANSADYAARAADWGITVIHRDTLRRRPMREVVAEAVELAGSAGGPVHVDLDVDVCDRSVAPGCPASLPGGLSAADLREAARAAGADVRVRSVDLVEVDAAADSPDGRTVRLVALCLLEVAAGRLTGTAVPAT